MIKTEVHTLESLLKKGKQRAAENQEKVLVTYTEKIEAQDPFIIFERMKSFHENRSFWKSATDAFYVITVGEQLQIRSEDAERYEYTTLKWKELQEEAVIYNPYTQEGTGLILTGGMSFDVLEEKTSLWASYPHSEFVVPKYTFTKMNDQCYLTMTTYISENDSIDKRLRKVSSDRKKLLEMDEMKVARNTVLKQTELYPEEWKKRVEKAIHHIQDEKAEKIVMARELRVKLSKEVEITPILERFLELQETSYLFAYERGDHCFIGATPERLVKVQGRKLLSTCLAGTAPRGENEAEDIVIKEGLFQDEKNRLEHNHVVQMIRRSITDICSFLRIPKEPKVITLKNLQHLYTPVEGEVKVGYSVFDIIKRLHPTPALGGAPTDEALAFIRENESFERGWYGSPVGWLDDRHNGEFAVAIRSGLVQKDEISLFAGCGVMGDSDVELEFEETAIKFLPMLTALEDENE